MSDTQTTMEEASRCPQCKEPGDDRIQRPVPGMRGVMVHSIYCVNQRCDWYNTAWIVQVNADGSIPPPTDHRYGPKMYVGFENADREARDIRAMLEAQALLETKGHGELRNPNA